MQDFGLPKSNQNLPKSYHFRPNFALIFSKFRLNPTKFAQIYPILSVKFLLGDATSAPASPAPITALHTQVTIS